MTVRSGWKGAGKACSMQGGGSAGVSRASLFRSGHASSLAIRIVSRIGLRRPAIWSRLACGAAVSDSRLRLVRAYSPDN